MNIGACSLISNERNIMYSEKAYSNSPISTLFVHLSIRNFLYLVDSFLSNLWGLINLDLLQGFGMLLMEEAERIAREEHGSHKIAVISGM